MLKLNMTRELDDGIKIFNSRIFKYIFHLKIIHTQTLSLSWWKNPRHI